MEPVLKSIKLANVCYDIRGPVLQQAKQMEDEGHKIIKLNIGNLAAFGFDSPEEIQLDIFATCPTQQVIPIQKAFSPHARRSCTTPSRNISRA